MADFLAEGIVADGVRVKVDGATPEDDGDAANCDAAADGNGWMGNL